MSNVRVEAIEKERVDAWFREWEAMQPKIEELHTARNKAVKEHMLEAITLYENFVLHASNTTLTAIGANSELICMPINGVERFLFIKAKPGQFACYRQLDELFKETKKRMARLRAQAKKA